MRHRWSTKQGLSWQHLALLPLATCLSAQISRLTGVTGQLCVDGWLPGTCQASEATLLVIAWSGGSRFEAAVSPQLLAVQQMLTQVPTHMMLPLSV